MNYLLTGAESERLHFRLLDKDDYNDWLPFFLREENARFVGLDHLKTPEERCDYWFERSMARYTNKMGGMNVLVNKESGKLVGQAGLLVQHLEGAQFLEIGYSLLPEYWGKGYAIEAASKLRDHAFASGWTDSLISIIHVENQPSMKVATKNGMQLFRTTSFLGMPVHVFSIERTDWLRMQS